jgi:hypothetical protein
MTSPSPDDTQIARLNHLYDLMKDVRGPIIDQAIFTESLLDHALATHFVAGDTLQVQLDSLVFKESGLSFASKINLLGRILELSYPERAHGSADLLKGLDSIRRMRNKLAHAALETSDQYVTSAPLDRVRFAFYRHGRREYFDLSAMERDEYLRSASDTLVRLLQLKLVFEVRWVATGPRRDTT